VRSSGETKVSLPFLIDKLNFKDCAGVGGTSNHEGLLFRERQSIMAATRRTLERSEHLRWLITLRRMSAGLQLENSDIACGARNTLHLLHRSVFIVDSLDGKNRCSDRAEVFPIGRKRGVTRQPNTPSPSPSPLTLTESSVEAMAQTPASWPSLVDQLKREGIELRDRGDTTNAIERLQEALDSEPNNAAVLSELAKTYDLMQLYDRANEIWRKLQEMGPSAGVAYELADRRLKPVLTRSSVA